MSNNVNKNGLTGYYFKDINFSDILIIDTTNGSLLTLDTSDLIHIESILDEYIKVVVWKGLITANETGLHKIYTNVDDCVIKINDTITSKGDGIYKNIQLTEGVQYEIVIEKFFEQEKKLSEIDTINLIWNSPLYNGKVPSEMLETYDFSNTDKNSFIPKESINIDKIQPENKILLMSSPNISTDNDEIQTEDQILPMSTQDITVDTDNDGIPDDWEINGYTVIGKKIVKWDNSYSSKGLKKYVSNPYSSHTANDPYTDYEKVSRDMDKAILPEATDPMVVAFPSVNVTMERLVVSKNQTISQQVGTSVSKTISHSLSKSITASLSGGFSGGITGISASFSSSFSSSLITSNTVSNTESSSFSKTLNIDLGHSAFLNPNVRYNNYGTAPIYNVQPTTSIVIKDQTVTTVKVQSNQIGNFLLPNKTYPQKDLAPLSLNTLDQFSSQLISINYDQLNAIDSGEPISLQTTQVDGNYLTFDAQGQTQTERNFWNNWISQIEATSSTFIFEGNGYTMERKVVAKNFDDPNDYTPVLTVGEAIIKAFNCTIKDGDIYFKDISFNEKDLLLIYDKYTANYIDEQLKKLSSDKVFDVNIKQGMKILIKSPYTTQFFTDPNTHPDKTDSTFEYFGYVVKQTPNIGMGGNSAVFDKANRTEYEYGLDLSIRGGVFKIDSLNTNEKYIATMFLSSDNDMVIDIYLGDETIYKNVKISKNIIKAVLPFTSGKDNTYIKINVQNDSLSTLFINHIQIFTE